MATRAEKLRRRQRRKEKKLQRGHGSASYLAPTGPMVIVNPRGEVKMSEVLMELIQPEWNTCANEEAMHKLLTLGMAAWNAALLPLDKRAALLADLATTLPSELRSDFRIVIEPFIRRKEKLFPHILRPMLSYNLTWLSSNEPHLTVVSGLAAG
jgi:hypothetical protein